MKRLHPDITKNHVRVELYRLYRLGRIRRPARGFYQDPSSFIEGVTINPSIMIHNLHLKHECNKHTPYGFRRLKQIVTGPRFASPASGISPSNRSFISTGLDWEGRSFTIQLTTKKNLLVEMSTTWNPLSWLDLSQFLGGWLPGAFDVPVQLWLITQVDFNIDEDGSTRRHRLVHEMSVTDFLGVLVRFYEKAVERLRTEVSISNAARADRFLIYVKDIINAVVPIYGPELDGVSQGAS